MPKRKGLRELMPRAYATRPGQVPKGAFRTGFQPSQETNPGRVPRKPSYPAVPRNLPPSTRKRVRRYF